MTLIKRKALLIFSFFWFFTALGLLAFFASSGLSHFDPKEKLVDASQYANFEDSFVEILAEAGVNMNQAGVIHFFSETCSCNRVAQEHIKSVSSLAKQHQFVNQSVSIDTSFDIRQIVPSTPAVAVINQHHELVYFGPYSAGYSCSPGNGIVERYIVNRSKNKLGANVVTDTLGCYCST
jgi:hypothetical protein